MEQSKKRHTHQVNSKSAHRLARAELHSQRRMTSQGLMSRKRMANNGANGANGDRRGKKARLSGPMPTARFSQKRGRPINNNGRNSLKKRRTGNSNSNSNNNMPVLQEARFRVKRGHNNGNNGNSNNRPSKRSKRI